MMAVEQVQQVDADSVVEERFVPDRWRPPTPGNLLVFSSPYPIDTPAGWVATDSSGRLFHRMADGTEDGTVTFRAWQRMMIAEFAGPDPFGFPTGTAQASSDAG